jgi:hypothetical protein
MRAVVLEEQRLTARGVHEAVDGWKRTKSNLNLSHAGSFAGSHKDRRISTG